MPKGNPGIKNPAKGVKKYLVGHEYDTPAGRIVVLELLPPIPNKGRRGVIRFVATGYVANVQLCNIPQGKIKDRREPTVYGVGYLDCDLRIPARESGSSVRKVYDLWANMLKRCYGDYAGQYLDCSVDPRWHSFKNFLNSVPELPGYASWEAQAGWCLDKDTRQPGNKVYSAAACWFIPIAENTADGANRRWAKASRALV